MKLIIAMILCITITQACIFPLFKGLSKHRHHHKCHKFPPASSTPKPIPIQHPTPAPPINQPQPPRPQAPLRNNFILTLEYACR